MLKIQKCDCKLIQKLWGRFVNYQHKKIEEFETYETQTHKFWFFKYSNWVFFWRLRNFHTHLSRFGSIYFYWELNKTGQETI